MTELIEFIYKYAPTDKEYYDLYKKVDDARETGVTEKEIVGMLAEILYAGLNHNDWSLLLSK